MIKNNSIIFEYIKRVGIALSILLNVILGGKSNQTFSARNYEWKISKKYNLVAIIDLIFFFDPDHCLHSWLYYKTTKNLRKKYANKELVDILPKVLYDNQDYFE